MSSREIADLLCCRHDNVKRTIKRLADKDLIMFTPTEETNLQNKLVEVYLVNENASYIVVAQLSPEFTARIVKRWRELEEAALKPQLPDFNNPAESARAWANEFEQKQIAQQQLAIAAPKVEFHDKIVQTNNTYKYQEAGKKIQQRPNKFVEWLRKEKYIDKLNIPYQRYLDQKLFKMNSGVSDFGHAYTQGRITNKGLAYFTNKLGATKL